MSEPLTNHTSAAVRMSAAEASATSSAAQERTGILLVFFSALAWSLGGAIARYIDLPDNWTIVFWRSLFATAFILGFMVLRDGLRGAVDQFRGLGIPGLAVALCFAVASITFVIAISLTTVANVILINAGVPLLAALLGWAAFGTRVSVATWGAIAAVIAGVAIMVSDSAGSQASMLGNALAVTNALCFATATVITRQYSGVRMTAAVCLGMALALVAAFVMASSLSPGTLWNLGFLFAFGALNLGLGMALFSIGARLVPAALTALIGTFETVAGPVWVWLVHGETPTVMTVAGGTVILLALAIHVGLEFARPARKVRPGVTGTPGPQ